MGVPTLIMARTDANSAHLLTSDIDARDREFCTGKRTSEGFYEIRGGLDSAIARGIAYAAYADLVWCETSEPNIEEARRFAEAVLAQHPDKMLAYNCSPSFNWKKKLDDATIAKFQRNLSMFELARAYKDKGMAAYSRLQEKEFAREYEYGYGAVKHQKFVGTGYFDAVQNVITAGKSSTTALKGSTEQEQFTEHGVAPQHVPGHDASCQPILGDCPVVAPTQITKPGEPAAD
jgi:isocitrate lyase